MFISSFFFYLIGEYQMIKIIFLIAMGLPACLPLQDAGHGVYFLIAMWYAGAFLLMSLSILEQNNVK